MSTTAASQSQQSTAISQVAAHRAFLLLRTIFTIAPIVFGLDKFLGILTDWDKYLAPWIANLSPFSVHQTMMVVGVIEIAAGVLVAVVPRWGSLIVVLWLLGIIVNLVTMGQYFDVALRDFGLLVASLALFQLSPVHRHAEA